MKYSAFQFICAALTGASLAVSLLFRFCDLLTYLSAVALPLIAALILIIISERKHPEWKRFNRSLDTWRLYAVKAAVFFAAYFVFLSFPQLHADGRITPGPAIIAMLLADFVYRLIISGKLEFDRLGTVDAVLEKHPEAEKYFNTNSRTGK